MLWVPNYQFLRTSIHNTLRYTPSRFQNPHHRKKIKHVQPVDPALLSFMVQNEDTTELYINKFLKVPPDISEQESYWFLTPKDPGDSTTYTPIQQRVYNVILELTELEKLKPHDNETSRNSFLSNCDWSDTTLSSEERQEFEEILIDFHDIFARYRFGIDTNCEFKVKPQLTSKMTSQ